MNTLESEEVWRCGSMGVWGVWERGSRKVWVWGSMLGGEKCGSGEKFFILPSSHTPHTPILPHLHTLITS
ncbi:MAG TPA: hypothetical protein VNM22_20840 [Candidatus Limnocylindrales bacterium]|nr:hypothetical protein [Candidatus Limnocylindrales bacterium]